MKFALADRVFVPPALAVEARARRRFDHASESCDDLVNFVCPLYALDARERPIGVGSGLLLEIGRYRLLLSAAHVLDDYPYLLVPGDGVLQSIRQDRLATTPPPSGRVDDPYDFSVITLDPADADLLSATCKFLPFRLLHPAHVPMPPSLYSILGFPASKNKRRTARSARRRPLAFTTVAASLRVAAELRRPPGTHLVLRFDRENAQASFGVRRGWAPDPHGLSGGGVWYHDPAEHVPPRLVGMIVETPDPRSPKARKYLIATHIRTILLSLRGVLPDLSFLL